MADERVTLQVDTEVNDSKIKAIDEELNRLKQQQLQLRIAANTSRLTEVNTEIENAKTKLSELKGKADVDDADIKKVEKELESLESEKINLQISVADDELTKAKAEEEALNTTAHVGIEVDDAAVQGAMQNIQSGLDDVKAGFSEVAQGMGDVLGSAGRIEQTETFLTMNMGADKAKAKLSEIREVTDALPGDDAVLQNLLSQAAIKQPKLAQKDFEQMGGAAADYMAAMQNFGKSATETQQDLMNYILAGNTAEVQMSPILQSHVDELKAANTPRERALALQKALEDENWAGISSQDTYNNKLQTFGDLLERGKTNLGGLFLGGTKDVMGFIGDIDEATGGVVGMGAAFATEFGPGLFQGAQGLISMGSGLSTMGKEFGGVMPMISHFAGEIPIIGGALSSLSLGPIALIIAAIVALGVAIYEVGKAFGWWKDVGGMFDAIKTGVFALWDAFISNPYVIQVIDLIRQGLTDAWNAISGFGAAIVSALSGGTGQFDILSFMIQNLGMVLDAVGPVAVMVIQGIIQAFRNIYTAAQTAWPYVSNAISTAMTIAGGVINTAKGIFSGLIGVWNNVRDTVSSMASTIGGALSAAGTAWNNFKTTVMNAVQPILDAAGQVGDAIGGIASAIGFGGIETPVASGGGYYGGNSTITQGNTFIFNMYGDIKDEKTLNETIDAIDNAINYEANANGVGNNNNGESV